MNTVLRGPIYNVIFLSDEFTNKEGIKSYITSKCADNEIAVNDALLMAAEENIDTLMIFKILSKIYKEAYDRGIFNDAYYILKDIVEKKILTLYTIDNKSDFIFNNVNDIVKIFFR